MFAKIYETSEGQILVRRCAGADGDKGMAINFESPDGMVDEFVFTFGASGLTFDFFTKDVTTQFVKQLKAVAHRIEED